MHRTLRASILAACTSLLLAGCGGGGGGGGTSTGLVAPLDVRISTASRMMTVSWDAVPGATGYNVYVAASPFVSPETYDDLPEGQHAPSVPMQSVRFEGLLEGGTYWAIVSAIVGSDEGPASAPVSAVLPVGRVRDLGTSTDAGALRVLWASTRGASSYEVFMAKSPDVSTELYDARYDASATSVMVNGLVNGETYWFAVRAANVNGPGPLSRAVPGVPSGIGTIESVTAFQTGMGATDMVLADLDGDGRDEIVVANRDDGTIQTYAQGGASRDPYVRIAEFSVFGDVPTGIGVLDANEDGVLDLAVARREDGTVTIHVGDGKGAFDETSFWTIPVGKEPADLVVADVDGNGFMDIVTADKGGPGVSLALGQSAAPYDEPVYQTVEYWDWVYIYDEWGYVIDQVWSLIDSWQELVGWIHHDPDPFQDTVTLCTAFGAVSLVAPDLDGDGDLDVVVVESAVSRMQVLRNEGGGKFSVYDQPSLTCVPDAVTVFNARGDVLVTSSDGSCVQMLLNDGTGGYLVGPEIAASTGAVDSLGTDMNGDGVLDVVVADVQAGEVAIWLGSLYGTYHDHFRMNPCSSVAQVRSMDVDGDGHMDLIVSDPVGGCVLFLYGATY